MKSVYIRFLSLLHSLEGECERVSKLDETAKHLLEIITLRHNEGKTLTVTEAMSLKTVASQATIHRKLTHLLELGLVEQQFEGKNRRTKFLAPTKFSNEYFERLGKALRHSNS
jgi:DNA-binding transcriptional ArsR family regulator